MIHVTTEFSEDCFRKDPDAGVLVHCYGGANRSATITAAYLSKMLVSLPAGIYAALISNELPK